MVFVDNAATTGLSKTALDAMMSYLTDNFGDPSSLHKAGETVFIILFTDQPLKSY